MHKIISYKTLCLVSDNGSEGKVIRVLQIEQSFSGHWVLLPVLVKCVLYFWRGWKLWKIPDCFAIVACQVVTQGNLAGIP